MLAGLLAASSATVAGVAEVVVVGSRLVFVSATVIEAPLIRRLGAIRTNTGNRVSAPWAIADESWAIRAVNRAEGGDQGLPAAAALPKEIALIAEIEFTTLETV